MTRGCEGVCFDDAEEGLLVSGRRGTAAPSTKETTARELNAARRVKRAVRATIVVQERLKEVTDERVQCSWK